MSLDLEKALQVAEQAARAGADVALHHFHRGVTVETKADKSPVSVADRETEVAILEVLKTAFPEFGVLAEESGQDNTSAKTRWIVDPIDGTRGYVRGGSNWGQLIALESDGEIVLGVIHVPLRNEHCTAAKGLGAFRNGKRVVVAAGPEQIEDMTLSIGETDRVLEPPRTDKVVSLIQRSASTRSFGDVMGPVSLLSGVADVWLEAGVQRWDLAAPALILKEAGCTVTDFFGEDSIEQGHVVAAAANTHAAVLAQLTG